MTIKEYGGICIGENIHAVGSNLKKDAVGEVIKIATEFPNYGVEYEKLEEPHFEIFFQDLNTLVLPRSAIASIY